MMSNVAIVRRPVKIPLDKIDGWKFITSVQDADGEDRDNELEHSTPWWYLCGCVSQTMNEFVWYVGQGRSVHTFRDLAGTIRWIGEFVHTPFTAKTQVMDLENPQEGFCEYIVYFGNEKWWASLSDSEKENARYGLPLDFKSTLPELDFSEIPEVIFYGGE